jgi:hypothetical protein
MQIQRYFIIRVKYKIAHYISRLKRRLKVRKTKRSYERLVSRQVVGFLDILQQGVYS